MIGCVCVCAQVRAADAAPRERARARPQPLRGRRVARVVRALRAPRGLGALVPQRVARHGLPGVAPPALARLAAAQVCTETDLRSMMLSELCI